jgi:hypothetical protein
VEEISREESMRGSPNWRGLNSFLVQAGVGDLDRIGLPGGQKLDPCSSLRPLRHDVNAFQHTGMYWEPALIKLPRDGSEIAFLAGLRLILETALEDIMILHRKIARDFWLIAAGFACVLVGWLVLPAQGPALEQQIAAIRATAAKNRAMLAEYTWQQQETISIKDKVQSQRLFEVQFGPDGRLRRTAMDLPEGNLSQTKKEGGMQEWVTQKKKSAVMMSAQEVKEIADTYAQLNPESLRLAYERSEIAAAPNVPGAGVKKLSIHNYVKTGDLVTMAFNEKDNEIQTLEVSSYLSDPKEPVHILVEFVNARDGLNHVDAITAVALKKNLSVVIRNLAYERTYPR